VAAGHLILPTAGVQGAS